MREIGIRWDGENRNTINNNFKEAEERLSNATQKAIEQIGDDFAAFKEQHATRFLDPVASTEERDSKYPEPRNGDTVRVTGEASYYRYQDGAGWIKANEYDPTAIDHLNQRLEVTEAQKADTADVQNALATKRDKFTPISLNDVDEGMLAAIQGGEGTTFSILSEPRDESVTPRKTTFLSLNKNLFNKATAVQGRLDTTNGAIITSDTAWVTSEPIPVKVGQVFKRSHIASLVQYDASGKWLSSTGANNTAFTVVHNADHIRLSVRIGDVELFQLEEGSVTTPYEPYGVKLRGISGVISKEETARLNAMKTKTIEPYGDEYPDTIYELLPAEVAGLTVASAGVTADYENAWKDNDHGYRIATKEAALADVRHELPTPLTAVGVQVVGVWIYIPEPSKITSVQVFIGDGTTGYSWNRSKTSGFKRGWNLIRWKASSGTMGDWKIFYRFMIRVNTSSAANVTLGSLFFEQTQKAKLLFVEDGGYVEFLERGYPDLKARNIPTTWALNPGRLGQGRIITEQDVDGLALDYMSSFSFHSWASEVHATMPRELVADNAIKCVRWLQKKGLKPEYLYRAAITQNSCPEHSILQDIVEAYSSPVAAAGLEVFPFEIPFGTPRVTLHGTTPAQMDAYFDMLKKTRGLMIGYTHGVGVASDTGQQLTTDMTQTEWDFFMQKIDTAISEGWLEGVTYDRLRRRYSKPSLGWGIESLFAAN